jgi:hypothetical protein
MKTVTATVCSLEREGDPPGGVAFKMTEPTTMRLLTFRGILGRRGKGYGNMS